MKQKQLKIDELIRKAETSLQQLTGQYIVKQAPQPNPTQLTSEFAKIQQAKLARLKQLQKPAVSSRKASSLLAANQAEVAAIEEELTEDRLLPFATAMTLRNRLSTLKKKQVKLRSDAYRTR